jgi:hypothetical protein
VTADLNDILPGVGFRTPEQPDDDIVQVYALLVGDASVVQGVRFGVRKALSLEGRIGDVDGLGDPKGGSR